MNQSNGAEAVVHRRSFLAAVLLVALVAGGTILALTRTWPDTPADRSGRSISAVEEAPTSVSRLDFDLLDTVPATIASQARVVIATEGRLLVHDRSSGTTAEIVADLPLTKPLMPVEGGVVGVSRGLAVFVSADLSQSPVELGKATEIFQGTGTQLWLSHNEAGTAYVELLERPAPFGTRVDIGGGVLVHGLANSGLLLGRSGATEIVKPGTDVVVAEVQVFAKVLSVRRDVIVGIDSRCDQRRCGLIIVDATSGGGGEWDLAGFRLPNVPSAELSPDASHLALFLVDPQRNLAVGVIDLATGDLRLGATVGSSRQSADVGWSRDGSVVYYVDPVTTGVVRMFSPFDEQPYDVVLVEDLGRISSVAELDSDGVTGG